MERSFGSSDLVKMKKLKENLGVQKLEGKTIMISVNSVNFVNLIYRIYRNYTHQLFYNYSITNLETAIAAFTTTYENSK